MLQGATITISKNVAGCSIRMELCFKVLRVVRMKRGAEVVICRKDKKPKKALRFLQGSMESLYSSGVMANRQKKARHVVTSINLG